MSLSFSIVIFAFLSPIYQLCGNSIILRKAPEETSSVDGKLFSHWGCGWTHRRCLCVCICFKRQVKKIFGRTEEHSKNHWIRNHVLLCGSGLRL